MDLRAASPTYDRVMSNFETAANQFYETGFFEASAPPIRPNESWSKRWREHDKQFPISKTFIRKVVRRIAKDLKRPVIIAETEFYSGEHIRVQLRKSKNTAPLFAQFMLLEEKPAYSDRKATTISWRQDGSNWYVEFRGTKGRRVFEDWKRNCRFDPTCRKALKLPPLEEEPAKLAA